MIVPQQAEPAQAETLALGGHPKAKPRTSDAFQQVTHEQRYQFVEELGRGGWGVVERALDQQLGREVAVKRIRETTQVGPETLQQFLHEAKITSQLQHPGVVPVHELEDAAEGEPYYVMKLLEGGTFRDQIRQQHASLPAGTKPPRAIDLQRAITPLLDRFVNVCHAVGYAHSRGIIHRDLKPANVMVGEFGETIVLDWGLAQELPPLDYNDAATANDAPTSDQPPRSPGIFAAICGTPAYMAPEQAAGRHDVIDHRADIFALGVMLYEIIAGRHTHQSFSTQEILQRARNGIHTPLSQTQPTAPKPLAAIVATAMATEPAARYSSALHMAADVRAFISGEHVSVHRESWLDRTTRWVRHHRALSVCLASCVFILLFASMIFSGLIHQAHGRERTARQAAQAAHAEAVTRLSEARQVTDSWLADLSGYWNPHHALQPIQLDLLKRAITDYKKLIANPAATTGDYLSADDNLLPLEAYQRAMCLLRLGDLYRLTDQPSEAGRYYQASENLLTQLASQNVTKLAPARVRLAQIELFIGRWLLADDANKVAPAVQHREWLQRQFLQAQTKPQMPNRQFAFRVAATAVRLELAILAHRSSRAAGQTELQTMIEQARWLVVHKGHWSDQQLSQIAQTKVAAWYQQQGQTQRAIEQWSQLITDLESWLRDGEQRPEQIQALENARLELAKLAPDQAPEQSLHSR
ncbi:serine/threonine-protein kinase [Planctomycetaceae bacterium SH139]